MTAKRLYEGMFLVDSALATADWEGTLGEIENVLKRAEADVVTIRKWSERKLAYDVDHKSRGTYILSYFNADGRRVAGIEKDVQLSEKIMRVLILGTEKRPSELIERDIAGLPQEESSDGPPERGDGEERPERPPREAEPSADANAEEDAGEKELAES